MIPSPVITEVNAEIDTGGGNYIAGNVDTRGGDFVNRDKVIHNVTNVYQTPVTQIPSPHTPRLPENKRKLIGRTTELAYYAERLQTEGVVLITGMAGVGKTSLAQMLVQRYPDPQRVFCHIFLEDLGLRGLIERMGEFLAWHGRPTVWQICRSASQRLTDELMLDYLISDLTGGTYLLWLDDLHLVEHYPLVVHFVKRLLALATPDHLQLIITSRHTPKFVHSPVSTAMSGLSLIDTQQLLTQFPLTLPEKLVTTLHYYTEGNAQFLTLAIDTIRYSKNPTQVIEHLPTIKNIEAYLLDQVDNGLNEDEKAAMETMSVLLGHPATRTAIEQILGGGNLRRTLHRLAERHLLMTFDDEGEQLYSQHAIVRAFYYAGLDRPRQSLLHQRAAAYFSSLPDFITAAIHWHKAGEESIAATLLYDHHLSLLNLGQAQAIYDLQARLDRAKLDDTTWAKLKIAAGRAATFVADTATALAEFAAALNSGELYLQAQALYYRAQILPKINLIEARCHFDRGMALIEPYIDDHRFATLLSDFYLLVAFFYLLESPDLEKAAAYLAKAQAMLSETDFSRQCDLHNALSILCGERGDAQGELAHLQQAYDTAAKMQANDMMILIAHNLGMAYVWSGQHTIGLEYLQLAQTQAIAIGHREWQGKCDQSMAASSFFQAHYPQAIERYQAAYRAFQQIGNQKGLAWVCHDLAEVYSKISDFALAQQYFNQAMSINAQLRMQNIAEALTHLAEQYPALLEMEKSS